MTYPPPARYAAWMPPLNDQLRRAPLARALTRVCEAVTPGSRPANVRRLGGGLDAAMHTMDLVAPAGERRRLVVRRYPARLLERDPGRPLRAWRTLGVLEPLGITAPRPVLFDGDGAILGNPGYVMTRLPGGSRLTPRDPRGFVRGLAGALAAVHRAPVAGIDLSFLREPEWEADGGLKLDEDARAGLTAYPDGPSIEAALHQWWSTRSRMATTLVHGDYWSGNTLWSRGRLTGVVDWDWAGVEEPGFEVGYCRLDMALQMGPEAADLFVRDYEAVAGWRITGLAGWDLLGAVRALPDPAVWLSGYHELGRADLTVDDLRTGVRAFIASALQRID